MLVDLQNDNATIRAQATLVHMIELGELGHPLPPERGLAQLFGVSRVTMRRAMDRLVERGRLRRVHGRGTFACFGPSMWQGDQATLANLDRPAIAVLVEQDGKHFNPQLTPWTWHICRALEPVLAKKNMSLLLVNSDRFLGAAARSQGQADQIHGFIAPTHLWPTAKYDTALALGLPFVGLGRTAMGMYWNILDLQWQSALTEALDDLALTAQDRVFIPCDPYPCEIDRQLWVQTVLRELDRHGVSADRIVMRAGGMFEPQGYLAMRWYLRQFGMPTLVLSDFDLSIVGAYRALAACKEENATLATDKPVRFLGATDMAIGKYLKPTLSTLGFEYDSIANQIMQMLGAQQRTGQPVGMDFAQAQYIRRESSRAHGNDRRRPSQQPSGKRNQ